MDAVEVTGSSLPMLRRCFTRQWSGLSGLGREVLAGAPDVTYWRERGTVEGSSWDIPLWSVRSFGERSIFTMHLISLKSNG